MSKFVVTVGDSAPVIVRSLDAEDAACDACEELESRGFFAGDEIPHTMTATVTNAETMEAETVEITHDWSINWYARLAKPASTKEGA